MDVEVEEVAKLLFPEGIHDSWKDCEEFSDYIIQLASCGVEKLGKEGAHLREERTAILDQTRDLAYTNYKTFIHTADCSRTIYKDFTSVESHLEGLSSCLPNLRGRVDCFLATSRHLAQSRHLTSLTLTKHTQLLEILELPQLMDTCVRNGYYEEALEILAYVRRLEKKHTDIPIIAGIVTEVQSGTRLMLSQLLAQLRSPLALPQCLKVIGLLRRLDVFTEPELRLKFLQARDSWFSGILKGIPKEDAYQHTIKIVEASRVHLFDIVTQYRAIFSDDDTRFSLGDPEVNEQAIFHGWILHKVNQFIKIVEKDLERGVGTNLEAVLAQCMFFGQSFSRIGADFRNLLIPLFQKAALSQCEKDIRTANIKFDETLSSFSLMEATQLSSSTTFMTETQDKTRPPLTLMEFPPLAHYMNGLVTAFNNLRQCCPVATLHDVIKLLHQSLTKVIAALLELHRLESSGFTAREEASFQRMCSVVAQGLLPHVNNCLRLLYPLQQISLITGVPVTQLQRENFGQLRLEELLAPVDYLLPKKEEENVSLEIDLQNQVTARETELQESHVAAESLIVNKISEIHLGHDETEKEETPEGDLHSSQDIRTHTAPEVVSFEGTTEGQETHEDQLPTGDQTAVHEVEVSGSPLDPALPLYVNPSDPTPLVDSPPSSHPSELFDLEAPLNIRPSNLIPPSDATPFIDSPASLNPSELFDPEVPLNITPSNLTPPSDPIPSVDSPPSLNPSEPLDPEAALSITSSDPIPSVDSPPSLNPSELIDPEAPLNIIPSNVTDVADTTLLVDFPPSLNPSEPLDPEAPLNITPSNVIPPSDTTLLVDFPPSLNPSEPIDPEAPLNITPSNVTPPSDMTLLVDFPPSLNPSEPLDPEVPSNIIPPLDPTPLIDFLPSLNPEAPLNITPSNITPPLDPTHLVDSLPSLNPSEPLDPEAPLNVTPLDPTSLVDSLPSLNPSEPLDPEAPLNVTPSDPTPSVDSTVSLNPLEPLDPEAQLNITPSDPTPSVDSTVSLNPSEPLDPEAPLEITPSNQTPPSDLTPSNPTSSLDPNPLSNLPSQEEASLS